MIYHETVRPRLSDFGRTGRMTCEAVLQILETAGSHHSDSAGDPLLRDTEEGAVWILTDWRARFLKPVISGEPFQVDTWMYKRSTAGITLRGYILTDEAGNELARAEAKCVLFDLKTERLVRVSEELFRAYQPEDRTAFDTPVPRLLVPGSFDSEKEIRIRESDLDFNQHVHNTRYLSLAAEADPELLNAGEKIAGLRISYRKPVKDAAAVTVRRTDEGQNRLITVWNGEELCTLFELEINH